MFGTRQHCLPLKITMGLSLAYGAQKYNPGDLVAIIAVSIW
jgi:hypothetical protein